MITLTRKLKKDNNEQRSSSSLPEPGKRVQEMESTLPPTCQTSFLDPNTLYDFYLFVTPDEGHWHGGRYLFHIYVTEEYNMAPPQVRCMTKLWHPNISEDGDVCLSLLRASSVDGMGWAPTRTLKDVVWGLNSLFTDLLNFDDPLNIEAAEMYQRDRDAFRSRVRDYVSLYAKR
ncbi:NEDD8-conjugating enzyme UBE2F-like isoform X2 [Ischnura elegans]|uniref:NEDD8-conjugating enzyme UBE2F-like isoform X2 n=1 Tax=Ischnura elegans TaxID=197161 RepID=UPI001ED87CF2|nr:NEDD8-conjugating enzyme UBE2F-like isoform X2 [Ischnura elegans]